VLTGATSQTQGNRSPQPGVSHQAATLVRSSTQCCNLKTVSFLIFGATNVDWSGAVHVDWSV
jgi:hypothetical protein